MYLKKSNYPINNKNLNYIKLKLNHANCKVLYFLVFMKFFFNMIVKFAKGLIYKKVFFNRFK